MALYRSKTGTTGTSDFLRITTGRVAELFEDQPRYWNTEDRIRALMDKFDVARPLACMFVMQWERNHVF